jgi:glycosyl transferase, family 25
MNLKLVILFGILIICIILGILIQNKNKYLEAFSNKLAKIDGTELYFVHIPKNAGTSILKHLCNNEQIGHTKLKDITDINVVKNSIAVIRNPYDRLYSIYKYTQLGKVKSYWGINESLFDYVNSHTFEEFVNELYLNNIKFEDQVHLPPQTEFIKWKDGKIHTKLIRFTHLNEDLSKYIDNNVSVPYTNKTHTKKDSWESHYTDEMKAKVRKLYKDDFDLFEKLNNSPETFQNNSQETHYFVHIPKNGGSSMKELLKNNNLNIKYVGHNYPEINQNEIVVLRDPIDRFISSFYYRIQNTNHIKNPQIYKIANNSFKNVNEFIEALIDNTSTKHKYANLIFKNQENHSVKNNNIENRWVFTEQYKWVNNPKYILRFTHLEDDFNKCLQDIGYNKKTSISKKNTSTHKDTYLSEKSIAFLKDYYRKDFELLESNPFTYGNAIEGFQNKNTNKLIDGVLYINLEHRTDRKKHIEKELNKLSSICSNIERVDAVKHKNGGKGCGLSHIKALETAKKRHWKNVLIVEDDLIFKTQTNPLTYLTETLNELNGYFDVLMLSGNIYKISSVNKPKLSKPIKVQTTSCYLINNHYYDKLINNFRESCNNLLDKKEPVNYNKWAIDQNWSKLQKKDNWFIFNPTLAYQMDDYSDIERKNVDYKT